MTQQVNSSDKKHTVPVTMPMGPK